MNPDIMGWLESPFDSLSEYEQHMQMLNRQMQQASGIRTSRDSGIPVHNFYTQALNAGELSSKMIDDSWKEAIVAVANELIKQKGTATSLEIMQVLVMTFPDERWVLSTISSAMDSVKTNYKVEKGYAGTYVYSSNVIPNELVARNKGVQVAEEVKSTEDYSIVLEGETIYGSRNILTKIIIALNLPYRFSESHNEFQDITKIPFTHLVNIVAKDMEGMSKDELKAYMNTPLFRYYATKV